MNVIISNANKQLLDNLNIEIIKDLNGQFDVDDIVSNFKNFFFQRMILDITALKNYEDITTIQKLSLSLDMNKVIILLAPNTKTTSPEYISQLISLGIYNFTTNLEGIMYLINSPNSYRDVAHLHIINAQPATQQEPTVVTNTVYVDRTVEKPVEVSNCRIIGIKNVTQQSGSTTFTYMMNKELSKHYKMACIEVEKSDFRFFNDKNLISATNGSIASFINKNKDKELILLDVNKSENAISLCNEIIYLLEPSVLKLNKLMIINPSILQKIKGRKIVLNQSLLKDKDVRDFEYESGLQIFYNMPPLDERLEYNPDMVDFLRKMGFNKIN